MVMLVLWSVVKFNKNVVNFSKNLIQQLTAVHKNPLKTLTFTELDIVNNDVKSN